MASPSSYEHSLANFKASLESMQNFISTPIVTDRDKAGVIQSFEYCFELSWKTVQKFSGLQELQVNGTRQALREALKFGFIGIEDEELWFEILKDRNLTSHTRVKPESRSSSVLRKGSSLRDSDQEPGRQVRTGRATVF